MKKAKFIIIPIVFVTVSLIVVAFGFGELNILPDFDLKELIGVSADVPVDIKSNSEIIEELEAEYLSGLKKNLTPENIKSLWIDIENDISASAEDGIDAVKYAIYSDCDLYRNFIPDTIFIEPDHMKKYSSLKEADGSAFDVLGYLLYYVKHIGCSAILVVDDGFITSDGIDADLIAFYLENYDFKGVLLSVDGFYGKNEYVTFAESVSSFIRKNYYDRYFGIEIHSDFEKKFADNFVSEVFEKKLVDFGYVDVGSSTSNEEFPFESVALWWNYFAEYYNVPLYCEHRLDLIFSDDTYWSLSTEINSQLKALYNCNYIKGNSFYGVKSLKTKKALARDLAIFLNDVSGTAQDAFFVGSLEFRGDKALFSGETANENISVFCNGEYIKSEKNSFSKAFMMKPGLNSFEFTANSASYVYDIIYNNSVFNTYYPEKDVYVGSDLVFSPYAVCPEDSVLYAVINGSAFSMVKTDSLSNVDIPDGYSAFSCDISFYGKDVYSDELSLVCFVEDETEIIEAGCVSTTLTHIHNSEKDVISEKGIISPYEDNGLGKSLMCYLKEDNTEIISTAEDYDTYHPYNSSLPDGTLDYVERINVSKEGYLRYELKSGINVYGVDSVLIYDAFTLPENRFRFANSDFSSVNSEDFIFAYDWLSPVTVVQGNLDYKKGYEGFSFNIVEYNASYIDVNFYYASTLDASDKISLNDSVLFSNYEIISDTPSERAVLRLYLRESGRFYGFDIIKENDNHLRISFKKISDKSIVGKTVMLDAGHGGISMVGTATQDNSVSEAYVTLAIAKRAKSYLESYGAKVIMTRVLDSSMTLGERTDMIEDLNPDVFVSIHCDGSADLSESGTHTFYYTPYSQPLASNIHRKMVEMYCNMIYSPADSNFELTDRKIKYYPFYVTRVDNCPAVLVETGFLTNSVEGSVLSDPVNQDYLGRAIADGIYYYFLDM